MEKDISWHSLSSKEVAKILKTNPKKGLSEKEVLKRRKKFGRNILLQKKSFSKIKLFLNQFKSPLVYILLIAGIIILPFHEFIDAIVIFLAVIVNVSIGYFQEKKANNALKELKKALQIKAEVIRSGNKKLVDSADLVEGDIFVLNPGDKVPADGRIIKSKNLKVNEMQLTGEWLAVEKKDDLLTKEISLAERDNMIYMGTIVESGWAIAIVVATGEETEIGKISDLISQIKEEETPLQKKIKSLSRIVAGIIIFICFLILILGLFQGNQFLEILIIAIAIAVAAIPEGLPVALTVILALGMQRILKKKGLVRKLTSAETLGSTSVIATDKTGTLTEGKMRITEIVSSSEKGRDLTLKIASFCSQAFIENPDDLMDKWIIRGQATDRALLLAGIEAGLRPNSLEKEVKNIIDIPFDQKNKYLGKTFLKNSRKLLYLSGAPENILKLSSYYEKNGVKKLSLQKRKKIEKEIDEMAEKGLRVIGVAKREIKKGKTIIDNLVFVGLIGLKDPVRKEARRAIKTCQEAGLKTIIVTGDHFLTAKAVAREIGFSVKKENILLGKDLDKMSDEEFSRKVEEIKIYARVEPKHKMRIIQAWQNKGEVIAMTGDGINDAPALKKADIGIALGSGAEVAKEVSDLILLTDNFSVIVEAIEEGRAIIDNIRKVITYLLSDSFTETILIAVSLFYGLPLPVTAAQILWVNLIEDGFPNVALAFEEKEENLMGRKVEKAKKSLLTKEMKVLIFIIGITTDFLLLGLFLWLYKFSRYSMPHIRTIIFAGLAIDSLFYVFSCKNLRKNIWQINIFSNKILFFSWVLGVIMLLSAIYLPFFQFFLKTYPLSWPDWGMLIGLGMINLILIETTKWFFIKKRK